MHNDNPENVRVRATFLYPGTQPKSDESSQGSLGKRIFLGRTFRAVGKCPLVIGWGMGTVPTHLIKGENAELICDYILERGVDLYSVKWYKDEEEFFRYEPWANPSTKNFPREGVKVDLSKSDSKKVFLTDVDLTSSGSYKCEVSAEAPSFDTAKFVSDLAVVAIPKEKPRISGGKQTYKPGDSVGVNCSAGPSKPAAALMWYINDEQADPDYLEEYPPYETRDGLEMSFLGLSFTARENHFPAPEHVLKLKCTATVTTAYFMTHSKDFQGHPSPTQTREPVSVMSSLGGSGSWSLSLTSRLRLLMLAVSFILGSITS
ncbi:unnamed protein product [Darwinula stevensoni]|uniref:Ig-like domain-containing protein n=1 Tax=Darwinula stevensoni TaxID=69355 RepID=A0A7R9A420_9CRUS|nr:unnamed protein product [Darwinula stevensoni]CAG0891697.1 unnamed protein product [Darwinula stevensoni]